MINRYNVVEWWPGGMVYEAKPAGVWCKWEDVEAALAAKDEDYRRMAEQSLKLVEDAMRPFLPKESA